MRLLRDYARKKKIDYFIKNIPEEAAILEVGSGNSWLKNYLRISGYQNYLGIDISPPADIVGDIREWKKLGLTPESFDVIIAFEVIEHVPCFKECYDLLKPNGLLMVTTPVPHMDWFCKILESVGLNQARTSPHEHLIYFSDIPYFVPIDIRVIGFIGQWGKFKKLPEMVRT